MKPLGLILLYLWDKLSTRENHRRFPPTELDIRNVIMGNVFGNERKWDLSPFQSDAQQSCLTSSVTSRPEMLSFQPHIMYLCQSKENFSSFSIWISAHGSFSHQLTWKPNYTEPDVVFNTNGCGKQLVFDSDTNVNSNCLDSTQGAGIQCSHSHCLISYFYLVKCALTICPLSRKRGTSWKHRVLFDGFYQWQEPQGSHLTNPKARTVFR